MTGTSGDAHFFETQHGQHMLAVDGSRVFDVPPGTGQAYAAWGQDERAAFLASLGVTGAPFIDDVPPQDMPVRSLSLAVAQKCNLACTYCYASGGEFGGPARNMPWQVAKASVDRLIDEAEPGDRINLAFLGGEPLINRDLIHRATEYATRQARANDLRAGFSITTNGTLLRPEDAEFFEEHGFAVTISLDGIGADHDRLRPYRNGRGSFDAILERIKPLLIAQRRMQVGARVTVTPQNMDLPETLDRFVGMGFHSVGFSPMLASPNGQQELDRSGLEEMLARMILCGLAFEAAVIAGRRYPFSNMAAAMHEIHRGTHRPYPCGAGAGYFGVSADGGLFACHRFVEDESGAMGDVSDGPDARRDGWLAGRHVHRQKPCNSCWARYLCGGGCHHEVIHRGRPACDYIRGWLHYCLQAYVRLMEARPDFFGEGQPPPQTARRA
ncbi:radical SAM protein [Ruegeria marisrubri]|uniref:Radical SAM protein n=1 Tax=Ruegeria marisrubri TaxID=1685379 RepID=A0A0X3TCH3_9RHOB|nr:radical SAM protein [Ruegeria marisrubri]KUJ73468.1 radical SAM protein [Ruegeria marisrubri]